MIFYDFGVNFMTLLVPLGALFASFLERIRALLAVRVPGRLLGWIWELVLMVRRVFFYDFGAIVDGFLHANSCFLCLFF